MKHLTAGEVIWCECEGDIETCEDPRDATCVEGLRRAAAYGAAAAMRCAAVEAGGPSDPELARERDLALSRVNKMNAVLEKQGVYFCAGCTKLFRVADRALIIGTMGWCSTCAKPPSTAMTRFA